MSLLLDAGALIAHERRDPRLRAYLVAADAEETTLRTSAAVVAQVWRDGGRQARLAQLLRSVDEVALTPERGRAIGALLARARVHDVVDAALVELAENGDEILTSDPDDLRRLVHASGKRLVITRVG